MRVLIADDENVIADSLSMIFRARGFDTRAVYNGEQALAVADSFQPDMLICDVVMRGVSGLDVGVYMREHLPRCRVLLFSGQATTADLIRTADTKGYHFDILTKPVPPQVLLGYAEETRQAHLSE